MTRTDTGPYADEQDPVTWTEDDDDAPWEGPLCECPQCEDRREQNYRRDPSAALTSAQWPRRGTKRTPKTRPARAGRTTDRAREGQHRRCPSRLSPGEAAIATAGDRRSRAARRP